MMIKAGLSLREAVVEVKEQTNSKKFKKVLGSVIRQLNNGKSLAESLSRHPDVFNKIFVNLIKAGEASGTLEENLGYLDSQLEKSYDLRKKIKAAMLYPIIILIAATGLVGVLSVFVLPKLIPLFESFNVELPLPTRILLWLIKSFQAYGFFIFGGIAFLVVFFAFISRFKPVKNINHRIILRLPIVGKLNKKINLAYFARTLGVLIKSGIPIVESFDITASTLNNVVYQKQVKKAALEVQRGEQIAKYFKARPRLFPSIFSRMISVGEKTGKLDESLLYLAEFYEKEVDDATKNLSTVLEPILLVIIGFIVGFIAVSIIMPIYKITHNLSGLRR